MTACDTFLHITIYPTIWNIYQDFLTYFDAVG